jgi:uncharacterized UBP type Zn finger protein
MAGTCTHLETIEHTEGRGPHEVCPACVAMGSSWVHLRRCTTCDVVGCCDDSPNRHATAHFAETGHPIIRSIEPGEDWFWCFEDEVAFRVGAD